jgi:adenosylcobinamide-phosphate synthase
VPHVIALVLGFLLDQLLGDPPGWPHPVRWLGRLILLLEPPLRRLFPERLGGIILLLLVAGTAGGMTWGALALAGLCHPWARIAVSALLIYYGLAARSLERETRAVLEACIKGDWIEARRRLGGIVGRDTHDLPSTEIYRACVETVAENTTDGVVAPLLYAALLGPVGLWVFKAVSTLDSMVGYRSPRYLRFGWASARADDLLNLLPARLTFLLLSFAASLTEHRGWQALRIGWRDGRKHPSPNAAWAEAAMAGALGVQLGGPATYQGMPSEKARLGDPDAPLTVETVRQAIRLMLVTAWLALALLAAIALGLSGLPSRAQLRVLQRLPGAALLRAGHALRDEVHPVDAVGDVGIQAVSPVELLAGRPPCHVVVGRHVDVGEGLQEGLGVAARQPARRLGRRRQVGRARVARVQGVRLAVDPEPHLVRLLLVPLQRPLRPVDLDPQLVLAAVGNL